MRQAGRYLPSYRKLRTLHSLSDLFHTPELAAEITLLPFQEFSLDAAILFSDLLMLAEVFDRQAIYPEGKAPFITPPVRVTEVLSCPSKEKIQETLSYVFDTIRLVKPRLQVPLLGFCPAPFTLLCYLLDQPIRQAMQEDGFSLLLDQVCNASILYAQLQFEMGVDALQVFDSWTHHLQGQEFMEYALRYWDRFVQALPGRPLLFFSRTNSQYPREIAALRPAGISFDEGLSLQELRKITPQNIAVQGNFSPERLLSSSSQQVFQEAEQMAQSVQGKSGIIFNLGHGVLPKTPLENVHAFLEGLNSGSSPRG